MITLQAFRQQISFETKQAPLCRQSVNLAVTYQIFKGSKQMRCTTVFYECDVINKKAEVNLPELDFYPCLFGDTKPDLFNSCKQIINPFEIFDRLSKTA